MKIEIDTDGSGEGTNIKLNGVMQLTLKEFNFSVRALKKCKLQIERLDEKTNKFEFLSFYGEDFKKFDEIEGYRNDENFVGGIKE